MAKQKGILKLKGTIGDVTFYKTKDGYLAREKGGIDKHRIANDRAFQRTRENGSEFGTAGKAGQLIRKSERMLIKQASDNRLTSRLMQQLMIVIKTDPINERGKRTVQDGNMNLLNGFDFNKNGKLNTVFFNGYTPSFDRATGNFTVAINAFAPMETIDAPKGTTHIQIMAGVCALNFLDRAFEEQHALSAVIPWDQQMNPVITLSATVSGGSILPVIQLVGVSFFQEVNGEMYSLRNGSYNALAIVAVDQL